MNPDLRTHISNTLEESAQDIMSSAQIDGLMGKIAQHPELSAAPKPLLEQAVKKAMKLHRDGYGMLPESEHAMYRDSFAKNGIGVVEKAYQDITAAEVNASTGKKAASAFERPNLKNYKANNYSASWKALSTENKVYTGMALLMAGMSALGAVNGLTHATRKDEQGNSSIQWSNVGLGLVSAAIAAGCAYAAHSHLSAKAPAVSL